MSMPASGFKRMASRFKFRVADWVALIDATHFGVRGWHHEQMWTVYLTWATDVAGPHVECVVVQKKELTVALARRPILYAHNLSESTPPPRREEF